MKSFLTWGQIISATLLIFAILLQGKDEGFSFGTGSGLHRSRRGFEKLLFYFTIFLAIAFLVFSFLGVAIL